MLAMSQAIDDSVRPAPADVRPQPDALSPVPRANVFRRAGHRVGGLIGLNQSTSLARRFLLASLLILVVGGLLVGWWVERS